VNSRKWHWSAPKIPCHTFVDLMTSSATESRRQIWLPRIAQKLERSITYEPRVLPEGWGVHIIEGPNRSRISWIIFTITAILFVASTIVSVITKQYLSIPSLVLGVLTLVCSFITSKYLEQKNR